jgi:hypothetical protein
MAPDETILTETPPLYRRYGRIGRPVTVPIPGSRQKGSLYGPNDVGTGQAVSEVTGEWNQLTRRAFLPRVRSHRRGRHLVPFEDRVGQHTAPDGLLWAACLGIEVWLLPRATPELDAIDHLWKEGKQEAPADRLTESIDRSALKGRAR